MFDRADADRHLHGDFLAGFIIADQFENLSFGRRQTIYLRLPAGKLGGVSRAVYQETGKLRADEFVPAGDGFNALNDFRDRAVF